MSRIAHDRARSILEHVGETHITPDEFINLLEADIGGSGQKVEDDAFQRLYQGYLEACSNDWVCGLLIFYFSFK
jgi:hypothetical protein